MKKQLVTRLIIIIVLASMLPFPSYALPVSQRVRDAMSTGDSYMLCEHWGGNWSDAEKTPQNTDDDLMDWAASASNVLEWTGWGLVEGMLSADDIFQYFLDHWTDAAGLQVYNWDWWFDGSNPSQGWPGYSQVDVPGGGFYPIHTFSDYYHEDWDDWNALPAIDTYLRSGYGVGIAIYTDAGGAHAITVWGFNYNPSDPTDYYGVWVSDSDDYKSWVNPPDKIRYYEVSYSSSDSRWYLQNFYSSNAWYIGGVMALEPLPSNRPMADAGGSYTGNVGSPVVFDASGSTDADGDPLRYRWDFDRDNEWDTFWSTTPISTYIFSTEHTGTVALQVFDDHLLDVDTATIIVSVQGQNYPPIASFTTSASSTTVGSTVAFSPYPSGDPDGGPFLLKWFIYDEQGTQVEYVVYEYLPEQALDIFYYEFMQTGTYTVVLEVSDYVFSSSTSEIIIVEDLPPDDLIAYLEDSVQKLQDWFRFLISDVIIAESLQILDRLYQLRDTVREEGQETRDRVDLVKGTLDDKIVVDVITGAKEGRYFTYFIHMTEWSDGDPVDSLDPEVSIRVAINDEALQENDYMIQRIAQGLCKLLIEKTAVPVGTNALVVDVEVDGVRGSDIIQAEKIRETKELVNIGVILSSDASYALSQPVIDLATTDINEYCSNLGYDIEFEFITVDADGNPDGHQERVQEFYDQGINLLIGGIWSSFAARSLDFVNENDMILFSPSSTLPSLAIPDDNLYRLTTDDYEQSKAIAAILEDQEIDSVVVVQIGMSLLNGVYDSIVQASSLRDIQVYPAIIYPGGARDDTGYDFSAYLEEAELVTSTAVADGENVGLLCLGFNEVAGLLNQVYGDSESYPTLDSIKWYGWEAIAESSVIESEAWDAAARYRLFSTKAAPTKSEKWYRFLDELGYNPGFYVANLYDICWIYAKAVLEASTTNTENVKAMLYDVTDQYYGVTGWCNLNEAGDRYPLDYDIMGFDSSAGWYLAGRYDKYAEVIFRR